MIRRRRRAEDRPTPAPAPAPTDWASIAAGGGPDIVFRARVATGDAARLAHLVVTTPLPGFLLDDFDRQGGGGAHYVDASTHEKLSEQRATGIRSNNYIFNDISVTGRELCVLRGYGGCEDPALSRAEMRLLIGLAVSADVTLEHWAVRQEGYGSDSDRSFVDGSTGSELLAYLSSCDDPDPRREDER